MLTIYADPVTVNSRKVLAGLEFLDVPFELDRIDYFAGGHKEPGFASLNPNAALPAAKDGDFVLWESNAILQYAADKHERTDAYPNDLQRRADINRWLLWEAASWFPSCYVYIVEHVAKPLMGDSPDAAAIAAEADNFHKLAGILNQRLSTATWLTGDAPTIADIAVAAPMHLHAESQLPLGDCPHLVRWMTEAVEELPCWQHTKVELG